MIVLQVILTAVKKQKKTTKKVHYKNKATSDPKFLHSFMFIWESVTEALWQHLPKYVVRLFPYGQPAPVKAFRNCPKFNVTHRKMLFVHREISGPTWNARSPFQVNWIRNVRKLENARGSINRAIRFIKDVPFCDSPVPLRYAVCHSGSCWRAAKTSRNADSLDTCIHLRWEKAKWSSLGNIVAQSRFQISKPFESHIRKI